MIPFRALSLGTVAKSFLAVVLVILVGYVGIWQWMICRIEVPAGHSLLVRYKGPWPFGSSTLAPEGTLVQTAGARPPASGRHPRGHARTRPPFLLAARIRNQLRQGRGHSPRQDRCAVSPRSASRSPREPIWSTPRVIAASSARS